MGDPVDEDPLSDPLNEEQNDNCPEIVQIHKFHKCAYCDRLFDEESKLIVHLLSYHNICNKKSKISCPAFYYF